ncbi:MAG: HAD hydrolase-like protein [Betaproteobacteria bacterium]
MAVTKEFSSIVFDLDGTLVDSAPGIISSFRAVLSQAGISPTGPLDQSIIGPPLRKTLSLLTGSNESKLLDTLCADFKKHYDQLGALETPYFPGIPTLLKNLINSGITLHICTNKRQFPCERILSSLGWENKFSSLYALDREQGKYSDKSSLLAAQIRELALDPATTAYIGDTTADGIASEANGIPFYYAAWGYGNATSNDSPTHWTWSVSPEALSQTLLGQAY